MENNKKNLTLSIVAVAVLMVAAIGATFAYFTASQSIAANLNLSATTGTVASLTATAGGGISMSITGAQMLESAASNTTPKGNSTSTLKVTLTGDAGSSCTYDVIYTDTSTTKYAQQVAGEFTLEGSESTTSKTIAANSYANYGSGTAVKVNGNTKMTITIGAGKTSAEHNWTFTAKFYNMPQDQSALAGKTYKGSFKVANVVC